MTKNQKNQKHVKNTCAKRFCMQICRCWLSHESAQIAITLEHGCGTFTVVVTQDAQSLADTAQAQLEVCLSFLEICMTLLPNLVHLGLLLGECSKLALERLNLLLELGRSGRSLIDLGCHLVDVLLELDLLCLRLCRLLVAICSLCRLFPNFLLKLDDHILDETLHLAERMLAI